MKLAFLLGIIAFPLCSIGQNIAVRIDQASLTAKKYVNEQLTIPINVNFEVTPSTIPPAPVSCSLILTQIGVPVSQRFTAAEFTQIRVEHANTPITFNSGTLTFSLPAYITIPSVIAVASNKALMIAIFANGKLLSAKLITIEPANDIIYSLYNYSHNRAIKLDEVTKVESVNNVLTVSGYVGNSFTKRQVLLERKDVLKVGDISLFGKRGYWASSPLSIVTVPFKVRPKARVTLNKNNALQDTVFDATAASGISNLGFNIDILKYTFDRYFATGKKATHKFGVGLLIVPGVEELSAAVVRDISIVGDRKSKQFYLSVGLSAYYSYNGITFFVAPVATDWAPSKIGEQWIYNKKLWWGFGIGISPTVITQVFNTK